MKYAILETNQCHFLKIFITIILLTPRTSRFQKPPHLQSLSLLLFMHTHLLYLLLPPYHLFHPSNKSLSLPPHLWMLLLLLLLILHLCMHQLPRVINLLLDEIHHAIDTLLLGIVPLSTQYILLNFHHLFLHYIVYRNLSPILW